MQDSVCLGEFEKYLTEVKKASANTLASYMRDVRQFGDYVSSHDLPGFTELEDDDLSAYITAITESLPPRSAAASPRSRAFILCC